MRIKLNLNIFLFLILFFITNQIEIYALIMIFALIIVQCGVILDTVVKQHRENYELEISRYVQLEKMNKKK